MARKQIITNKGLELLGSASLASGQFYWLGYYALAYVPNNWKQPVVDLLANGVNQAEDVDFRHEISDSDSDLLVPEMTKLTKYGDMIWNVFQGDLVGTGFLDGMSDGSAGGDLFGLTLYGANIKKHYRYVLDNNKNNTLVAWEKEVTGSLLKGAKVYYGTDGFYGTTLPVPAPLFYFGDATKNNTLTSSVSKSDYINDFLASISTECIPTIEVYRQGDNLSNPPTTEIPRVSSDFRGYVNSRSDITAPSVNSQYFDENEVAGHDVGDVNAWFESASTFIESLSNPKHFATEFQNLLSISNYNRYHAPVDNEGSILSSNLKNRNFSKATKFFPISHYSVINSERGVSSIGDTREVATGINISIELNLAPQAKTMGFVDDVYNQSSDLTLQDYYNNPNNAINHPDKAYLFNSTKTSFKFNRIGLYAVPIRKAPNVQSGGSTVGTTVEFEIEINPDIEPILFAVADFDSTTYMSDSGDGLMHFRANMNVNLQSPDGVEATGLVRDTAIFYNLYKDDAVTWYKNQLISNASLQHAVSELSLEVLSLRDKYNRLLDRLNS